MRRLVVIGAGISGLSAAVAASRAARREGLGVEVLVLERASSVGGKARTVRDDGYVLETGPMAFLGGEPALDELIDAAGLREECIPADEASAHRFVVRGGRLREVHAHPLKFAGSGILGPLGMARLLAEPFIRRRADGADESVFDFACRRIGRQAAERLVAPMVLGVYAGDARRLSLAAAFPKMAALEREHGSLIRGLIAKRKDKRAGGPTGPAGGLYSFRNGLDALPSALVARGPFEVRCGAEVTRVLKQAEEQGGGWRVFLQGEPEPLPAAGVILAAEPYAMASLVRDAAPDLADLLDPIFCPPVAVVALGFKAEDARAVPRGFGVLVPSDEDFRMLGCLFDSYLFPRRSPDGTVLLHAMIGGAVDSDACDMSENELLATVRSDLSRLLGITAEPTFRHVKVWRRAIPQYELGHVERVRRIEQEVARLPGLHLAGNALFGIAFSKAAAAGKAAGEAAVRGLGTRTAPG